MPRWVPAGRAAPPGVGGTPPSPPPLGGAFPFPASPGGGGTPPSNTGGFNAPPGGAFAEVAASPSSQTGGGGALPFPTQLGLGGAVFGVLSGGRECWRGVVEMGRSLRPALRGREGGGLCTLGGSVAKGVGGTQGGGRGSSTSLSAAAPHCAVGSPGKTIITLLPAPLPALLPAALTPPPRRRAGTTATPRTSHRQLLRRSNRQTSSIALARQPCFCRSRRPFGGVETLQLQPGG